MIERIWELIMLGAAVWAFLIVVLMIIGALILIKEVWRTWREK